ncbi:MAG: hypothetical protein ACPGU4_12255, partial [Flavobacteriales bacterium]
MLSLKNLFLFCCTALICHSAFSQNPAHFVLGENEFSNTQVYSLKQHPNGLLYAATNYGLYVYKHGRFKSIPFTENRKISSLFSIRLDSKNNLYCTTLTGDIFRLKNDSLELYTQLPSNYRLLYGMDFVFDQNDHLVARSGVLARYKNNKWEELAINTAVPANLNGYNSEKILFPSGVETSMYQLDDGKIEIIESAENRRFSYNRHTFPAYANNRFIGIEKSGYLHDFELNERYSVSAERVHPHQTEDGDIWLLSDQAGIMRLEHKEERFGTSKKYFDHLFVSTISVAEDGVVFLGTFGHGVIVIPNQQFFEYETTLGRIEGLTSIPTEHISPVMLKEFGQNKLVQLITDQNQKQSILVGRSPLFFDADFKNHTKELGLVMIDYFTFSTAQSLPGIKEFIKIDNRTMLLATSRGLFKSGPGLDHIDWSSTNGANFEWQYTTTRFRCKAIGYVSNHKDLFYTKFGVLRKVDRHGIDTVALFKNQEVKSSDILSNDTMALIATHQHGVLLYKGGELTQLLSAKNGLQDHYVRKVVLYNNKIYVACRSTFQVYNLITKQWESLGKYHNVIKGAVSEMLVVNDKIWMVAGGKLMALPLAPEAEGQSFSFNVEQIVLGDSVFSATDKISSTHDKN